MSDWVLVALNAELGRGIAMLMGKHSLQNRNFFEQDEDFPENLKGILKAYDEAARWAALTAKYAARDGTLVSIRKAQWWETVTQTIEECLRVAIRSSDEFEMPTPPEFDVA